ncbi:MAG TPA: PAS domain S-box protein, partial [Desulfurivibrionaceae bacterium]|nr:PAS domain S-box protein [Desulfurivibrionaceae bacterium]
MATNHLGANLPIKGDLLDIVASHLGAGLAIISRDYRTLWANEVITSLYGDTVGKVCHRTYNQQEAVCPWCGVREVFDHGKKHVVTETVGRDKNGDLLYCEIIATPIYDDAGTVVAALELVLPINERKKREQALHSLLTFSQKLTSTVTLADLYREVTQLSKELLDFDFSTLMLLTEDKNSLVIRDALGFPASMIGTFALLKGQGLSTYVVAERKAAVVTDFHTETRFTVPPVVLEKGITSALSVPMMLGNEVFGVLIGHSIRPRVFSEDDIALYQALANQAAVAIKNAQHLRDLASSEAKFRTVFDSTNDAILIYSLDGVLLEVNELACLRLGYAREELIGRNAALIIAPPYAAMLPERIALLRAAGHALFETAHLRKDGTAIPIELSCRLMEFNGQPALLGVARDISERKKTEEERLRAQKLESIGLLAGGIAHDFNNLLTGILGNIGLAKMMVGQEHEALKVLAAAEKASVRAKGLTQQLLTFAKGGAPIKSTASLADPLREWALFATSGSRVTCDFAIAADLWPVEADMGQLGQVIHNLVLNACHAMPGGGAITINAHNVELPEQTRDLKPGSYLHLAVTDHGIGIAPEHLAKIFDPYFSTKETGSGLGLAVAYSIIKNHGGRITVESTVGQGTTFHLYLPAAQGLAQESRPTDGTAPPSGQGALLIMDDEEIMREVFGAFAEKLGFAVVTASDGAEALRLYEEALAAKFPFALVIMDLTVPGGMGGKEMIGKLLALDPSARAIVSSGYSNDPIMSDYARHGFVGVAPKPITFPEFAAAIAA